MEGISQTDLERWSQTLETGRGTLLRGLASRTAETAPVELDQAAIGRLSRQDAIQRQQMAKATADRNRQRLARLDAAIKRFRTGGFGYCVDCEDLIETARLDFDPTITLCQSCAAG